MRFSTFAVILFSLGVTVCFAAVPSPVKNPCSLAPVAESSAALKAPLKAGLEFDGTCMYNDAGGKAVVILSANSVETAVLAGQSFAYAGKDSVKPVDAVPGVGDEAKITYSNSGPMSLVIRKGATMLIVSVLPAIGGDLARFKPGMIVIGKAAAGRL